MTGIAEVAQVVFVRKSFVEVQYLRTTITDEQREEFGRLVGDTIQRIESASFSSGLGSSEPSSLPTDAGAYYLVFNSSRSSRRRPCRTRCSTPQVTSIIGATNSAGAG